MMATCDGSRSRAARFIGTASSCGRVLAESDLSGNLISEYTYFGDLRTARRDVSSGNVYYIFSDRLGSYRTLADSSGNVKGESDYYPFGAERVISSTVTENFRFAGMEWDMEDGLNHTLYRQYTPAQCRWETPDPVRGCVNFPQGQNLYAYVRDNPTNGIDLLGAQFSDLSSCSSTGGSTNSALCSDTPMLGRPPCALCVAGCTAVYAGCLLADYKMSVYCLDFCDWLAEQIGEWVWYPCALGCEAEFWGLVYVCTYNYQVCLNGCHCHW
jgi:RHS repeat-associated protein